MATRGIKRLAKRVATFFNAIAYLRESSLHGVRYVGDPDRHWVERLFWFGVCVAALVCTYFLLMASWFAFQNNAVSFVSETAYLDWNTTFPALSVCETESPDKLYESATRVFGATRNRNLDFFLRDIVFFDGTCRSCSTQCGTVMECREDFQAIIGMVRSACLELLTNCRWNGQPFDCCKNFLPLQTETGLCFTINSIHNRYHPNGTKVNSQLVDLISNLKTGPGTLDFMARESIKIYIHSPEDVPNFNHPQDEKEALFWGLTFHMRFSVTEIENDPQLLDVSVAQRNCRLPDENPLTLHNKYSYSTCIVECHARYQMEFCNCTHHYMPNTRGLKVKTCGVAGLACLNAHSEELRSLKTEWSTKPGLACDCVSSCTEPEYSVIWKSSQGNDADQDSAEQGTRVRVMMDALPSTRFKRNVVRTRLDLVVSMGGTAGLFLGASLLTIVEVVYYAYQAGCKPHEEAEAAAKGSGGHGARGPSSGGSGSLKHVAPAPTAVIKSVLAPDVIARVGMGTGTVGPAPRRAATGATIGITARAPEDLPIDIYI